jgi:acetyltransferase-like isoleucine patch superfamily enzyme
MSDTGMHSMFDSKKRWERFWMRFAGLSPTGRMATFFAAFFAPPHKERIYLANMNSRGYISVKAKLFHSNLTLGSNIFIDDYAMLFGRKTGGEMKIGNRVNIYRFNIFETGYGGTLEIGDNASIHPKCQINAYVSRIFIGSGTMLAPCCALYSYNHGLLPDQPIRKQPKNSLGGIHIGNEAWLGYGCIVLDGVTIGDGAAIGAGSVVTRDIPEYTVAAGNPAKVLKHRKDIKPANPSEP